MLHIALLFLGGGNLLCGFAKTPIQLYVFRAISGLGGGGVNGIAMTVVSILRGRIPDRLADSTRYPTWSRWRTEANIRGS